jgi:hypothetical protein
VWDRLDELIEHQRLMAPKQVLEELQGQDDYLLRWARKRKRMFARTSLELVRRVQKIVNEFPRFVDPSQPIRAADPFVVALAIDRSKGLLGDEICVVTEEKYGLGRPRIPHVCEAYGLKYLTVHQVFVFEGWSF